MALSFIILAEEGRTFLDRILASHRSGDTCSRKFECHLFLVPGQALCLSLEPDTPASSGEQSSLDILPVQKPESELFILNICGVALDPGLTNNIWATLFLKEKYKYSQSYTVIPNLCFLEKQVLRAWWFFAVSADSDIKESNHRPE